ncbi:TonB-dependent receptor [Thalassotalea sp. M1531]|uniref:TonB-dependent receptor n=1 Tax=Thalassotalea algicola TaxID=2716224 RepID=A0A7Y0Q6N0_9GAMM|nr:TonB-dependent receptor [Thalassotalea algicola]NMP31548.1 TonB-dependent receptor [Thalassotalea algicola]
MNSHRLSKLAGAVVVALGLSTSAMANTITSAVKGQIVDNNGAPATDTTITITHVPSGTSKTIAVNQSGSFSTKGLRVGGPYTIVVDSESLEDQVINDVYLTVAETYPLNVSLNPISDVERIEVTGRVISANAGGTGPATHFGLEQLENLPAINRDITDIVRVDPRVYVDETSSNAIQCGGAHPRFNSLTLDGVRMNDRFGLNSSGYPTERIPFSYDAIEQVAVELAPFDVNYGGFTACNINAVTKSGTNEIKGGFFYDYTSDSLKGDKVDGEDVDNGDYTEERYGFNVGLPIIEDELFLFVAYEKLEGAELFTYPGLGNSVTQSDLDRIGQISNSLYGYDIGSTPASMPVEDEKVLVKVDWNINDAHRAAFVYNYNDGFSLSQSDDWAVTLDSHFYERGAEFTSLVGSLYSDWSDSFSTEVRVESSDLDNRQESLDAASSFAEVQIRHNGNTIFLGPDDSRQSNDLNWENLSFKVSGTYYLDDHEISAGIEYEDLEIFNLFMQHTQGEYRFDSIDDFEAGTPARIYYNNSAGTNDPNDVAASFAYQQTSLYIQDVWSLDEYDLTLTMGIRYDKYSGDDKPRFNQNFQDRYGFANNGNFDGLDLWQPRFGFNWIASEQLEVRGGFGLFSGGNPNVWLSNSYSNDGLVQIGLQDRSRESLFDKELTGEGRPIYDIPQALYDTIAGIPEGSGDGDVNAIDPNFEIPSEWKYSLGATYVTEDNYIFSTDVIYTKKKDAALINNIAYDYSGDVAPDGRPMYEQTVSGRFSDFMLTNVDGDSGESTVLSFTVSKDFENGFDASFGYSHIDSEDVSPMTSSVAGSNFSYFARTDSNNPGVATSDYVIPQRFTLNLGYNVELFDGYSTRFSIFASRSEGKPISYTFNRSDREFGDSNWSNSSQLMYVPTFNDPLVTYDGMDEASFQDWIESVGLDKYRGKIAPRNELDAGWWTKVDFRISQEIPGFMDGHKGKVFFVIKNLGNLLNDEWGVLKQYNFSTQSIVNAEIDGATNTYVYSDFFKPEATVQPASLYEIRMGISYKF